MIKQFNLPIIYFLILLISKEIFSYDSEKIVILCILTFIITAYYQAREGLYETFQARTSKLEEEFLVLLTLKNKLESAVESFWQSFISLENQLIQILVWIKNNIKKFIVKANANRALFNFHIAKDQLNLLYKENLLVNYGLKSLQTKSTINNFNLILESKVDYNSVDLSIMSFLDKLKTASNETTFTNLIINKLNINKEIYSNTGNWRSFDTSFYY